MAEPTLKDVLDAIAKLATKEELARLDAKVDAGRADLARLDATVAAHRAETETHRAETARAETRLDAKIDTHRVETAKGFADLDRELTKHAEVHREIEKDLTALKRRPARTAARPARRR